MKPKTVMYCATSIAGLLSAGCVLLGFGLAGAFFAFITGGMYSSLEHYKFISAQADTLEQYWRTNKRLLLENEDLKTQLGVYRG